MKPVKQAHTATYNGLLADVAHVIEAARHAAARSVNAVMTITYWLIVHRIIEQEQQGAARAGYGEELLKRLARDLSKRFGRGFSQRNLEQMRAFYLGWPISQTASAKLIDLSPRRLAGHGRKPSSRYGENPPAGIGEQSVGCLNLGCHPTRTTRGRTESRLRP